MDDDLSKTFVLAENGAEAPLLSVHVKRSYAFDMREGCRLSDAQAPLLGLGDLGDSDYSEPDIIPNKLGTDLIVLGSVYAPGGQAVRCMIAAIACGDFERAFFVQGDRRCSMRPGGPVEISEPETFEVMPLCHSRTYGGADPTVLVSDADSALDGMFHDACIYPRNPLGRGYAVSGRHEHVDGLQLPNVEDPADLLTPERVVSWAPENWWRQPLPWGCGPYDISWYPRSLYFGGVPRHLPEDDSQIEEVRRRWVQGEQRARFLQTGMVDVLDPRSADAASPGMTLPLMRGDETVMLSGMTPAGELMFALPGARPSMMVRFFGRSHELPAVLQRVVIDVEARSFSLLWRGAWAPPRLSTARALEVSVDGESVQRLGASVGLSASRYSRKRY